MDAKKHYEHHLAEFYEWMVGDFDARQQEQQAYFEDNAIFPKSNHIAIDLGAGHGLQSVSLAKLGFEVKAIDFNILLLNSLQKRKGNLHIDLIESDLIDFRDKVKESELIVCMGDTISHLDSS